MKKPNVFLFLFLFFSFIDICQSQDLSAFDNLVGRTWQAVGNWGDGTPFNQKIYFSKSRDQKMITTNTESFIDEEKTKIGSRFFGGRNTDIQSGKGTFWEVDVQGEVIKGEFLVSGKDIYYNYKYGETLVTDLWKYADDNKYLFKVGVYKNGVWESVFLETSFSTSEEKNRDQFQLEFIKPGVYVTKAWDGELRENWYYNEEGGLGYTSKYIEDGVVSYSATGKMKWIGDKLILISVIKDSNPKIFECKESISLSKDEITFENSDYKNPNKVHYRILNEDHFQRTISGIENGAFSTYTFDFKKIK